MRIFHRWIVLDFIPDHIYWRIQIKSFSLIRKHVSLDINTRKLNWHGKYIKYGSYPKNYESHKTNNIIRIFLLIKFLLVYELCKRIWMHMLKIWEMIWIVETNTTFNYTICWVKSSKTQRQNWIGSTNMPHCLASVLRKILQWIGYLKEALVG